MTEQRHRRRYGQQNNARALLTSVCLLLTLPVTTSQKDWSYRLNCNATLKSDISQPRLTRTPGPGDVTEQLYQESDAALLIGHTHDPYGVSVKSSHFEGSRHESAPHRRSKRGVLHLYNMISCATGCDPISYKGYGCYCGFLGAGVPLDGIDNCCRAHDRCYENIFCAFYTVYFQPYYWQCYHREPLCALENYSTRHSLVGACAARLCECDRQFAMCLRHYRCPRRPAVCTSSPLRFLQNLIMLT